MSLIFIYILQFLLLLQYNDLVSSDCAMHNYCNGHGSCDISTSSCLCYEGWGASTDITYYRAPDCSSRVCPNGRAWADVPTSPTTAHQYVECSNRGTCDRTSGTCTCFTGFTGSACNRNVCPNDCSGHGVCVNLKQMARMTNALPLAPNTYYEGDPDGTTWDEEMIYGCVCDSSWPVGLGLGETQEPEWFGPDCSQKHCPSADNPRTADVNETDCYGVTAKDSIYQGEYGNLCQVDCANNGLCNHKTGICECFNGYYGQNCTLIDTNVVYYTKANKT